MKVLLDIDILLDVVLARQPWVQDAVAISNACAAGKVDGFVAAFSVPTL